MYNIILLIKEKTYHLKINDEKFDTFIYDPSDPVPTTGGTGPAGGPVVSHVSSGPKNHLQIEKRNQYNL